MKPPVQGIFNWSYRFGRLRNGILHTFEAAAHDDGTLVGNGKAYGRALYTSQHFLGESLKIKGREFIIDDNYSMSVVWDWWAGDKRQYMTYGHFTWEEKELVLAANY